MSWHAVADTSELSDGAVIGREPAGHPVALYRVGEAYFATAGLCTHAGALLCRGEVVDGYIECPVHFGLFEIATGKAAGAPVSRDLRTYRVRIEGTRIEVEIDEA